MAILWMTGHNPYDHWTLDQQTFDVEARKANGEPCRPRHPEATCWCAYGWLQRQRVPSFLIDEFEIFLLMELKGDSLTTLNDTERWAPIMFRRAWTLFLAQRRTDNLPF